MWPWYVMRQHTIGHLRLKKLFPPYFFHINIINKAGIGQQCKPIKMHYSESITESVWHVTITAKYEVGYSKLYAIKQHPLMLKPSQASVRFCRVDLIEGVWPVSVWMGVSEHLSLSPAHRPARVPGSHCIIVVLILRVNQAWGGPACPESGGPLLRAHLGAAPGASWYTPSRRLEEMCLTSTSLVSARSLLFLMEKCIIKSCLFIAGCP